MPRINHSDEATASQMEKAMAATDVLDLLVLDDLVIIEEPPVVEAAPEAPAERKRLRLVDWVVIFLAPALCLSAIPLASVALTQVMRSWSGETSHMSVFEELDYRVDLAMEYQDLGILLDTPFSSTVYDQVLADAISEHDPDGTAQWKPVTEMHEETRVKNFRAMYIVEDNTVYIDRTHLTVTEIQGIVQHELSHVRWSERVATGVEEESFINHAYGKYWYDNAGLEMHADCESLSERTVVTVYWDCAGGPRA